jgi:hypothetical protein
MWLIGMTKLLNFQHDIAKGETTSSGRGGDVFLRKLASADGGLLQSNRRCGDHDNSGGTRHGGRCA